MDKNWLIRTRSNHILGPISKEKVLELFRNGSIKSDDEVCIGNGYWFFIREDDLVERFLLGDEIQGFNPMSEAKDVLTLAADKLPSERTRDDITLIGSLDLNALKAKTEVPKPTEAIPENPAPQRPAEIKKKVKAETKVNISETPEPKKKIKKQSFLKYLGILGFIILFLLIYFRKTIIQSIFHGEVSLSQISLISVANAQDEIVKKKKILERVIEFDKVEFRPVISLDGFRVESSFDLEKLSCDDLKSEIYQLGIILVPTDTFNEKFLIKIRDCVLKLPESHSVKRWLKWVSKPTAMSEEERNKTQFLSEIINSQFNLITDNKVKIRIIDQISDIPSNTLGEKILKSYLYLMIGNITRSDNILKEITKTPPRENWKIFADNNSLYQRLVIENLEQIINKFSKHPADRRSFELFSLYIEHYFNDENLKNIVAGKGSGIESKVFLRYVETMSPGFVHYLRLNRMSDERRIQSLRDTKLIPLPEQSAWEWVFMDIDPYVSDLLVPELERLEKVDQLWLIYILDNEKIADLYLKKGGKIQLSSRRSFLRSQLVSTHPDYMMSLFKLIEFGDIDANLVSETLNFIINE